MESESADTRRLFFALWPDADTRATLVEILHGSVPHEVRATRSENMHITLAFLGHLDAAAQHCAEQAAARLRTAPFNITLNHLGYWPHPRILWLGTSHCPNALLDLVAGLHQTLAPCRLALETRPYQPHLTVARKVQKMETLPTLRGSVSWRVRDFVLAESFSDDAGAHYRVLARWPLQLATQGGGAAPKLGGTMGYF
ncbi:MAG: RNA 2',3'-cyclic phosphodiesterase [Gammaproteobacteria bacterium]|nr:RNA 2',3'-cyclic phosphodiesterase [Gammaproteobacteria bacterium]